MSEKFPLLMVLVCLAAWVNGCAVPVKDDRPERPDTVDLAHAYVQAGKNHETAGEWLAALKHFKLAMTVDPDNKEAFAGCNRLEHEIRSSAERRYSAGLSLQEKGKYALARKEFLAALRLNPDHEKAREMITAKKRVVIRGYVLHTVKSGETLSELAARYYGDYRKFAMIAQYNNLGDSAALRVGQELKIPEALTATSVDSKDVAEEEGLKKSAPELQASGNDIAESGDRGPTEESEWALKEVEMEQVAIYRDHGIELFNDKAYQKAIIEFNKVLASNPDDRVASDYLYKCHFHQSINLYEKQEYLAARDGFRTSLKYRGDCRECHAYMNNCENFYKKMHYTKGMQFYHKEQLEEAIREWELVRKEDPDYKKVNYLINKARGIQKKMNELKSKGAGE